MLGMRNTFAETEEHYQVHTEPNGDSDWVMLTTHKNALAFRVRACRSAHIILTSDPSQDPQSDEAIELIIGANQNSKTEIKFKGEVVHSIYSPDILDCKNYRSFWVTIEKDQLLFGRGHMHDERLMEYEWQDSVCCAYLSTTNEAIGEWLLYKDSGISFLEYVQYYVPSLAVVSLSVYTPDSFGYHPVWTAVADDQTSITFQVKACHDASLYLSEYAGITTSETYEIGIGTSDNTK